MLFLSGCTSKGGLALRTDYLTPAYLASNSVDAPDPNLPCFYGQQIVVHWTLAKSCMKKGPKLFLTVRFGDRSMQTVEFPLCNFSGYYVYQLVGASYLEKQGILSYKAEIFTSSGQILSSWRHHIWADIIEIQEE